MSSRVELLPHNPAWAAAFEAEAARLITALQPILILVHHIGSTRIPRILAKPTIDILVEVTDIEKVDQFNEQMVLLGYQPKGENGIPRRRYFRKVDGERHTHHVHVFGRADPEALRHLNFCAYLIAFPDAAQEYSQLKERLARQYPDDREAYTNGKETFIRNIDRLAKSWREGREIEDWR